MSNEEAVMHLEELYQALVVGYTELDITEEQLRALEYAVTILEEC
jgi:hypothetical protein